MNIDRAYPSDNNDLLKNVQHDLYSRNVFALFDLCGAMQRSPLPPFQFSNAVTLHVLPFDRSISTRTDYWGPTCWARRCLSHEHVWRRRTHRSTCRAAPEDPCRRRRPTAAPNLLHQPGFRSARRSWRAHLESKAEASQAPGLLR